MTPKTIVGGLLLAFLCACGEGEKKDDALSRKSGGGGATVRKVQDPAAAGAGGYGYTAVLGADADKAAGDAIVRGRKFLLSKRSEASGAWEGPVPAGFTALAALALIGSTPREDVARDPILRKALAFVAAAQKPNGSVSSTDRFTNYETAAAVGAFAHARLQEFADAQAKARDYLVGSQIAGEEGDASFGGFPYVSKSDPSAPADLSNAQFAATAAHDAGVEDPAFWKRFLVYLGRVQNRSETNAFSLKRADKDLGKEVEVVSGNDGGAGYSPGVSKAGLVARPDGRYETRSYGSMTYALLKCLLFAGVKADDPRVEAAVGWIRKGFTVDRNPGFESAADPAKAGAQGYYYYLLTMARALSEYEKASGKPLEVTDAAGKAHAWRREIATKLASLQAKDGSWSNPQDRWEEGSPVLVTAYALQTLALCQGRLP
jgi:hypothetical protein